VLEALDQPRASFAEHTPETPWSTLQLAYFVGTAMWTYLTQPFTFTLPGFETSELEPWNEAGQQWRRLHVAWPSDLATQSSEETLYFNTDGLLARHDYDVEISGGTSAAHYVSDYDDVAGIKLATKHRIFPRTPRRPVARRAPHRRDRSQRDRVHLTNGGGANTTLPRRSSSGCPSRASPDSRATR
jgi:hypothetical protein